MDWYTGKDKDWEKKGSHAFGQKKVTYNASHLKLREEMEKQKCDWIKDDAGGLCGEDIDCVEE